MSLFAMHVVLVVNTRDKQLVAQAPDQQSAETLATKLSMETLAPHAVTAGLLVVDMPNATPSIIS